MIVYKPGILPTISQNKRQINTGQLKQVVTNKMPKQIQIKLNELENTEKERQRVERVQRERGLQRNTKIKTQLQIKLTELGKKLSNSKTTLHKKLIKEEINRLLKESKLLKK